VTVAVVGINHIALEVDDLDAALAWYERFFAFELRGRRATMAWIDLGDQFIALSVRDTGAEQTGAADAERDRGRHVGIVVTDREALRRELRSAGIDVSDSGSLRVHDPGGNQLEIVDYRDVQFSKTDAVLAGMGLDSLEKSAAARAELSDKGLGD
jgi:catechol 2,3-dioxygenase-like lactoylglutathione lyase family enzyme